MKDETISTLTTNQIDEDEDKCQLLKRQLRNRLKLNQTNDDKRELIKRTNGNEDDLTNSSFAQHHKFNNNNNNDDNKNHNDVVENSNEENNYFVKSLGVMPQPSYGNNYEFGNFGGVKRLVKHQKIVRDLENKNFEENVLHCNDKKVEDNISELLSTIRLKENAEKKFWKVDKFAISPLVKHSNVCLLCHEKRQLFVSSTDNERRLVERLIGEEYSDFQSNNHYEELEEINVNLDELAHLLANDQKPKKIHFFLHNFEETFLTERFDMKNQIKGFRAQLSSIVHESKKSDTNCTLNSKSTFTRMKLPITINHYYLDESEMKTPYLAVIDLRPCGQRGYEIPRKGRIQLIIFNPSDVIRHVYLLPYDLHLMPNNSLIYIRHRITKQSHINGKLFIFKSIIQLKVISARKTNRLFLWNEIRMILPRNVGMMEDDKDSHLTMATEYCYEKDDTYSSILPKLSREIYQNKKNNSRLTKRQSIVLDKNDLNILNNDNRRKTISESCVK
ncbi:hypothetical protein SNEBB_006116 [Seison nebaliae]|nr:hypothetical protein SNEBB_006116 [Seison nebaliae]